MMEAFNRMEGIDWDPVSIEPSAAGLIAASAMHLMVRSENEPAVRLYASAGYESPPRVFLTKAFRPR
jgi:hypothetical protein